MTSSSQLKTGDAPKNHKITSTKWGIAYSILINGALPLILFSLLKRFTNVSDFWALVVCGIPPMIDAIVGVIRKGSVNIIAGLALLSIAVSIILIFLGGSPRLLLIRESFITGAIGLAYLVSLLFPKPLNFYFARHFMTGDVPEKIEWFNALWQYPAFRHTMRLTSVVWGVTFLLEVAVRGILVFTLTIQQFLIFSPFVFYGFLGGVALWTFISTRKGRERAAALMPQSSQESDVPVTESKTIIGPD
jgi:hypothetical protein